MQENFERDRSPNIHKWVFFAGLIVISIFIGAWLLNRFWHPLPPTAAEFGDSFGAANALFSALAFAGIIITILLQRRELELQRNELKETKLELRKSAQAQENTQKTLNLQVSFSAKQTLLNSLKVMYELERRDLNSQIPNVAKRARLNTESYYLRMEELLEEIESAKTFFDDPDLEDLINNYLRVEGNNK